MSEMSQDVTASPELRDAIWALEYTERAALLMCSIIEQSKHDPVKPVLDMMRATGVMAKYLNIHDRVVVANAFRDCACLLYTSPSPRD